MVASAPNSSDDLAVDLPLALDGEAATTAFATRLAGLLQPGDLVLLDGPVGAGKTFLARAAIHALQSAPEDVPSPTFTLVQTYETVKGPVWHADLYRLTSSDEIEELGLAEAFETAICLVEWPDRLGALRPNSALTLSLHHDAHDPERRLARLSATHPAWAPRIAEVF